MLIRTHTHTHTHTRTHTHCIRLCPEGLSDEGKERKLSETPKLEWEMITMEVSIKEGKNSLESNILQIHMSKQKRVRVCVCVCACKCVRVCVCACECVRECEAESNRGKVVVQGEERDCNSECHRR